jgi:hypothetical protein
MLFSGHGWNAHFLYESVPFGDSRYDAESLPTEGTEPNEKSTAAEQLLPAKQQRDSSILRLFGSKRSDSAAVEDDFWQFMHRRTAFRKHVSVSVDVC